jgi:hypothetical protein
MRTAIAAALTFATKNSAVYAQTASPAEQPPESLSSGADATIVGPGITMGMAATTPLKTVEIENTDRVTSKRVGMTIYN